MLFLSAESAFIYRPCLLPVFICLRLMCALFDLWHCVKHAHKILFISAFTVLCSSINYLAVRILFANIAG